MNEKSFQVFESSDVEKNRIMAALAYILFFIPLIACPGSRYGRFHANQGLLLLIGGAVGQFILSHTPILKWFMPSVYGIVIFVLCVYGIVNALGGKATPLPVFGGVDILK